MFVNNYAAVHPQDRGTDNLLQEMGPQAVSNNRLPKDFIGVRRPFIAEGGADDGHPCVIVNTGQWTTEKGVRTPIRRRKRVMELLNSGYNHLPMWVFNATSLRKEDWIELDRKVLMASREPLVAYEDLRSANSFGGFNAYGKMTLEYEAMSDPGEAVVDMDLLTAGRTDNPLFKLRSMPLPCTHSDFWYSDRRLEVSGNSGTPLDAVSAEAAARRISEMVEDTTIGIVTGSTYGTQSTGITAHDGTSTVYGYTNHTYRATKTNLTTPTGANPNATINDVLDMIQTLALRKYYGPFMLYTSLAWQPYLDGDYAFTNGTGWATNPSKTLRNRLKEIPQIQDVKELYRLSTAASFVMVLVQMTSNVAEAVEGVPVTTLQWETQGGLRKNFKVWSIQVPRLRAEYNGYTGILHATTS